MTSRFRTHLITACGLLLAVSAANAQTTVKYHVVKLAEVPAPSGCVPTAINENGDVVGYCNAGQVESFGVLWSGGAVTDLGRLIDGTFTHAWGINSLGQIVGDGNDTANNLDPKALTFGPSGWIGVDGSGGSAQAAYGVTDDGVIFGNFTTVRHPGTADWDPVFWTFDAAHDRYDRNNLPKPVGTLISGAFIQAATKLGIAVGQVASDLVGNQGGLWKNDPSHTLVVLDKPAGFASGAAFGVSDDGRAVGYISNPDGTHAALWQNDGANTPVDLGALPGDPDATANGVNTAGQVVGVSTGPTTLQGRIERAFLFQNGSLVELSTLVDPADGAWTINQAAGINNAGQIIAVGVQNGQISPVLLMPVTVACSTISITAPALAATVGDPFSAQLSASGGTAPYSFHLVSGVLPAGLTLSSGGVISGTATAAGDFAVTVSASDAGGCASATESLTLHVAKGAQTIAFGALPDRVFGDLPFTVSATGGASGNAVSFAAAGACSMAGSMVTITGAGSCTITASQAGNANYLAATDVPQSFSIAQGSSVVGWAAPAAIVYGTPLGATQLNATAGVPGAFVYSPAAGTVLSAGDHTLSVIFTPSDAGISGSSASVQLHVNQAVPVITWAKPADITQGTPLGAAQLSAAANTPGSFAYAPPAGTVLPLGPGQTLSVVFTPADAANYTSAAASVLINVVAAPPPPADNILAPIPDQQNREGDKVEILLQVTGITSVSARRGAGMFSATSLPPGLWIDSDKGVIKGKIKRGAAGQYQVTVTLTTKGASYVRSFVWTVTR